MNDLFKEKEGVGDDLTRRQKPPPEAVERETSRDVVVAVDLVVKARLNVSQGNVTELELEGDEWAIGIHSSVTEKVLGSFFVRDLEPGRRYRRVLQGGREEVTLVVSERAVDDPGSRLIDDQTPLTVRVTVKEVVGSKCYRIS